MAWRFFRRARSSVNARYRLHPNGDIYDSLGRYWIGPDLWGRRIAEGRSPYADHNFAPGTPLQEEGIPSRWGRVAARCRTCGEERKVFHGVDMDKLNHSWCVAKGWNERRKWNPKNDVLRLENDTENGLN